MAGPTGVHPSSLARLTGISGATAISAAVVLVLLLAPAAGAWSVGVGGPMSWSNGVVFCQFAPASPSVEVSAATLSGSGVTVSLLSLNEGGPGSSVAAIANLTGVSWSPGNWSGDDAFDQAYTLHATLSNPASPSSPVGSTDLTVQFVLPAYQGSPEGPTDAVNVLFTVENWTWQHAGDHLELAFSVAPTFPSSEHLNASSAPGWMLASTSNSSGSVLEQVGANASATAATGSGPTMSIAATPTLSNFSPASANLSVAFAGTAGEFTTLTYSARVGVVLPASVAGIPLSEILAASAAGVVVSLCVAMVARRVRRRPSNLIYVTEEEKP